MTTLIPKIDLKNGGSTPTGAINRAFNQKLAEYVTPFDFGAVGDGVADDATAIQNALNVGKPVVMGKGTFLCKAPITIPDNAVIDCSGAEFRYDDTAHVGTYLFTNGTADTRSGGLRINNLSVTFATVTGKGIDLRNNCFSYFSGLTYFEGHIPDDWATNQAAMRARTNTGIRMRTDSATDGFLNHFEYVHLNHLHFGVINMGPGDIPGANLGNTNSFFKVYAWGDALYGDDESTGFLSNGNYGCVINDGYFESYGNHSTTAGAFYFIGQVVNHWTVTKCTFEQTLYSVTGLASPMKCITFKEGDGRPHDNLFINVLYNGGVTEATGVSYGVQASYGGLTRGAANNIVGLAPKWGTWTPVATEGDSVSYTPITTTGTITASGTYIQTGRVIFIQGKITITGTVTQGGVYASSIRGLPFIPSNNGDWPVTFSNTSALVSSTKGYLSTGNDVDGYLTLQSTSQWQAGTVTFSATFMQF